MLQTNRQEIDVFENDAFKVGLLGIFRERSSCSYKPGVTTFQQNVRHTRSAIMAENTTVINFVVQPM